VLASSAQQNTPQRERKPPRIQMERRLQPLEVAAATRGGVSKIPTPTTMVRLRLIASKVERLRGVALVLLIRGTTHLLFWTEECGQAIEANGKKQEAYPT
jgi:hypothetical protein